MFPRPHLVIYKVSILMAPGLNKYRPHNRTTIAQHDGTVGRVRVPSCCVVAGQIPFAACMKTQARQGYANMYFTIDMGST